jgi:hypothetical protein
MGQRQSALVARGDKSVLPTRRLAFMLPLRRVAAPSECPIDFLVRMSSRTHFAGKLYFVLGPRSAHFHRSPFSY